MVALKFMKSSIALAASLALSIGRTMPEIDGGAIILAKTRPGFGRKHRMQIAAGATPAADPVPLTRQVVRAEARRFCRENGWLQHHAAPLARIQIEGAR